jgi:hypothetical protein
MYIITINVNQKNMITVKDTLSLSTLKEMSKKMFGNLVKAVVDIKREIMVVDADLHSDEESLLLNNGSKQEDIWGINIYPELPQKDRIEFDSMINLRPGLGNNSRGVDSLEIRKKIIKIVNSKIVK